MKIFFVLSLLILSGFSYGQNIYIEFASITNGRLSKDALIINDSISIYKSDSDNSPTLQEKSFLIKKHVENAIYLREGLFNQLFYVKDSLHSMEWKLTNDTKLILTEECFSAKTYFRGRNYTAYYTTAITNSDGPWKFGGLPGLILEIKSDDNHIQFIAEKIKTNYTEQFEQVKINDHKFMNWDEYVNKFINTIDKYIRLVRSNGSIDNSSKANIKIDAPEIIYPKAQEGEGISF